MSITLAVISSDLEYVARMMSYMKGSPIYHPWRLQLYSTPERIHQLNELERMELIVVEEGLYNTLVRRIEAGGGAVNDYSLLGRHGAVPIITLIAQRRQLQNNELHKFQAASSLLHGMQLCYESLRNGSPKKLTVASSKSLTISICSTMEQTGKTTMALHTAALLANKGYRVFYCNLEIWNTVELFINLSEQPQASYSDLLYFLKSKQKTANWLAQHAVAVNGYSFYTLHAFQHESDRLGLTAEDGQQMVAAIRDSDLYDYVIVDMPSGLNSWTLPLIQQCDVHFMLVIPQSRWQSKHQLALAYAERLYPEMMDELKMKGIVIMNELYGIQDPSTEAVSHARECLPFVAAWQQNQSLSLLLISAGYRAVVERCITPFLLTGEKAG